MASHDLNFGPLPSFLTTAYKAPPSSFRRTLLVVAKFAIGSACLSGVFAVAALGSGIDIFHGEGLGGRVNIRPLGLGSLYHSSAVAPEDAERLAAFLRNTGAQDHYFDVHLAKTGDSYVVSLFTDARQSRSAEAGESWRQLRDIIGQEVYPGKPVRLQICDHRVTLGGGEAAFAVLQVIE